LIVFPESKNRPPGTTEHRISVLIALLVRADLLEPELRVRLRRLEVSGTTVPVAPVDEDRQSQSREGDICAAATVEVERRIHAVPEATRVQETSYGNLRRRIASAVRLHVAPNGR
jgi:hypothetical protein